MLKALLLPSLLVCVTLSAGCSKEPQPFLAEMPPSVFEPEPEYTGRLETVGDLSEAYIRNTASLRQANNKLHVLCVAALICEDERSDEE